ncbi:MAG: AraC family transcriptional regulator [Bacillota bacterium]|nr:AraC family transcriptional regulator [Bacillota bacterium]
MDFTQRLNLTMEYIESHLAQEISPQEIERISLCPMHQFGRIFSYVTGMSLSAYIRRRRLTSAAYELQSDEVKIIDLALKYGYQSPNSFTRAFTETFGMTPGKARCTGVELKAYPRLSFHMTIKGDAAMNYRIEEKGELNFTVKIGTFRGEEDGGIWDRYYSDGTNTRIRKELKLCRPPFWHVGIYMPQKDGSVDLALGAQSDGKEHEGLKTLTVPARTWAVFTVNGTGGKAFGETWAKIITEWLPSSGYTHLNDYEIEVFPDGDAKSPDYKSEIWIPVTKK